MTRQGFCVDSISHSIVSPDIKENTVPCEICYPVLSYYYIYARVMGIYICSLNIGNNWALDIVILNKCDFQLREGQCDKIDLMSWI